jgi:Guanylylate cyclase
MQLCSTSLEQQRRDAISHVVHVRQQHNWDCGLACVMMALRTLTTHAAHPGSVYTECKTKSVWTVDLAHLLARHGCSVLFYTLTVGANPAFASEGFYKGQLAHDRARVECLFAHAADVGIVVRKGSLSWEELRDDVQVPGVLAIVLVDKWRLRESAGCCCGLIDPGYAGALRLPHMCMQ